MELSKQALFRIATERFNSWSDMYVNSDVSADEMYLDMCASCFSGEKAFDFEDRYMYTEGGTCHFLHKGVDFTVLDLRDMRGDAAYYDICICICQHRDSVGPQDDACWPHFLPDAWLFGSTSDEFEAGRKVDARFVMEADKYIGKIGREKLIELQKPYKEG